MLSGLDKFPINVPPEAQGRLLSRHLVVSASLTPLTRDRLQRFQLLYCLETQRAAKCNSGRLWFWFCFFVVVVGFCLFWVFWGFFLLLFWFFFYEKAKKAFQNLSHKGMLFHELSRLNKLFVKEQSRHMATSISKEIITNIIISIVTEAFVIIHKPKRHRAYFRV